MVRILLAVFGLTVFTWALAAFVPLFQGWHHLAKLGLQFFLYLLVMSILLQGFRRLLSGIDAQGASNQERADDPS